MIFCRTLAIVLAAAVLSATPSFAGNDADLHRESAGLQQVQQAGFGGSERAPQSGKAIVFKSLVSFKGRVSGANATHTLVKADSGMTMEVPNLALVYSGNKQVLAQNAELDTDVVVQMRPEEPYQIMSERTDEVAIGSYEGVFWVSRALVQDVAVSEPYRDTADVSLYDDEL